jgi:hypothetical protein
MLARCVARVVVGSSRSIAVRRYEVRSIVVRGRVARSIVVRGRVARSIVVRRCVVRIIATTGRVGRGRVGVMGC